MQVEIRPASLVIQAGAPAQDSATVGVAAIQKTEGRRIVAPGAVALVIEMKDGRRVDVLCDPEEAQIFGCMLISSSYVAANALPPILNTDAAREVVAMTAAPRIVTPGRH